MIRTFGRGVHAAEQEKARRPLSARDCIQPRTKRGSLTTFDPRLKANRNPQSHLTTPQFDPRLEAKTKSTFLFRGTVKCTFSCYPVCAHRCFPKTPCFPQNAARRQGSTDRVPRPTENVQTAVRKFRAAVWTFSHLLTSASLLVLSPVSAS